MSERSSPAATRWITPLDVSDLSSDSKTPTRDEKAGTLFAVYGPRADTGATTVAEALSLALRMARAQDVALAELDPRIDRGRTHDPLSVAIDVPGAESAMVRRTDGVWTFAMTRPRTPVIGDAKAVTVALDAIRARFPLSVAELEPQMNERTLAAFDAADRIVLVTQGTVPSLRATQRVLRLCRRLNYPDEKMCLVLNRTDAPGSLSEADVAAALRRELYWTLAPRDGAAVAGLATKLLER